MANMQFLFNDLEVHIVEPRKVKQKRTWFQRLTEKPFFTKYQYYYVNILEFGQIIRAGNKIMVSPETYHKLIKEK